MSVTSTAWSVFTWATAGLSRSRMPSRSAACGPETPAISDTAAVGLVTQAGEGVQMGWLKRRICPRVVLEMARPAGSCTFFVTMTAYSVFSASGGSGMGLPGTGTVAAGWMPMIADRQVGV